MISKRWPKAAWGGDGKVYASPASMWPIQAPYKRLLATVEHESARPLSHKAASGFYSRMQKAKLRFDERFRADMADHVKATS